MNFAMVCKSVAYNLNICILGEFGEFIGHLLTKNFVNKGLF